MIIRSYFRIKSLTKKGALNLKSAVILFTSTLLSTIARILFAGQYLYSTSDRINPLEAIGLYYTHALVMVVFNLLLNTSKPTADKKYIFGLLLNSLSSIYCYNHYNYACLWEDVKTKNHQPSAIRQGIFYIIIFLENLVLTILVLLAETEGLEKTPELPGLWLAWGCQIIALAFMAFYYLMHPLRFKFEAKVGV